MNSNFKVEINEKTDQLCSTHKINEHMKQIYFEKIKSQIELFKESYDGQIKNSFKSIKESLIQLESHSEEIVLKKDLVEDQISQIQEIQQIQAEYQKLLTLQKEEFNQENDVNQNLQNFIEHLNKKIQILDEDIKGTLDNKEKLQINTELVKYISGIQLELKKDQKEIQLNYNQECNANEKVQILFYLSPENKKILVKNIEPKIKNHNSIIQLFNLDGNYHELICRVQLALKQK